MLTALFLEGWGAWGDADRAVAADMFAPVAVVREGHRAHRAHEGPLARVCAHVFGEVAGLATHLAAHATHVLGPLGVGRAPPSRAAQWAHLEQKAETPRSDWLSSCSKILVLSQTRYFFYCSGPIRMYIFVNDVRFQ